MRIRLGIAALLVATISTSTAWAGNLYFSPNIRLQQISANHSRFRGLHFPLALGYANYCGNYYFAGEVFVIPGTISLSDTRNPGATSTKVSTSFGASLIPGKMIYQDILGYGRLGLISSKFSSPNVSTVGTQLGLGLQTKLTRHWAIRGEYVYTIYGSVDSVGTPNSNELGVGLMYFFDH